MHYKIISTPNYLKQLLLITSKKTEKNDNNRFIFNIYNFFNTRALALLNENVNENLFHKERNELNRIYKELQHLNKNGNDMPEDKNLITLEKILYSPKIDYNDQTLPQTKDQINNTKYHIHSCLLNLLTYFILSPKTKNKAYAYRLLFKALNKHMFIKKPKASCLNFALSKTLSVIIFSKPEKILKLIFKKIHSLSSQVNDNNATDLVFLNHLLKNFYPFFVALKPNMTKEQKNLIDKISPYKKILFQSYSINKINYPNALKITKNIFSLIKPHNLRHLFN